VQPGGQTVGFDIARPRIEYAKTHYSGDGIKYVVADVRKPLEEYGQFDFVWIRFVLEYYLNGSFEMVKNIAKNLKPGGLMCLIDLDCNCLRHFGLPDRLARATAGVMKWLEKKFNFDPYVGVKLYSFLHDLGFEEIDVNLSAHNMFYGTLKENEKRFSMQKAEIGGRNSGYPFEEYDGDFDKFIEEVKIFFNDPRVFYYTPLIGGPRAKARLAFGHPPIGRGRKPL